MAINKRTFRNNLRYYMDVRGMPLEDAYQHVLREGLDDSISNIPTQVSRLVNTGIPFEKALEIVEEATFNNNFNPYRAALQEYRNRQVYRSPEPNGRDYLDVDKIVKDILSNKPELGNGYYPPMGMSTSPNSQHSQYSVVPKQPITEDMTPVPTKYPYELGAKDNQDIQELAPEGYTPIPVSRYYTPIPANAPITDANSNVSAPEGKLGLPISGMYDESAVSTDTNEPSGKVVVGRDTEVPTQSVQPVAKSPRRATKPRVINNTSTTPVVNTPTTTTFNVSAPVAAPTLSSVTSQAVRHNGGFDNYRRQSVLSALRAAGGISPAEAVQRGIIPMEALNYI